MSKTKTETPVLCNSADIPWEETRLRHKVDKRIYLLVGWTGLGLAFSLVDLLIALPIPKDENGMIES